MSTSETAVAETTAATETAAPAAELSADEQALAMLRADTGVEPEEATEATEEEPAPTPEEQRRAARLEAAARAEQAAAARRAERRIASQAEQAIAQARQEYARVEQEKAALAAEKAELERRREAIKKGGLSGLHELGFDLESMAKEELEKGSPDYLAKQAIARAEAAEKQLQEYIASQQRQQQQQQLQAQRQQETEGLVSYLESAAAQHPHASVMPPEWVVETADAFARAYVARHNDLPSFAQVSAELDRRAEMFQRQYSERAARIRGATTPGQAAEKLPRPAETRPPTRTLSAATASARATSKEMTKEEMDKLHAQMVREMLEAEH